jgi:hypothetical protein
MLPAALQVVMNQGVIVLKIYGVGVKEQPAFILRMVCAQVRMHQKRAASILEIHGKKR